MLVSQVKDIFGLKNTKKFNGALKIPRTLIDIVQKMSTTNIASFIVSAVSIIYLIMFKELINPRLKQRFKFEFPSELLLVGEYFFKSVIDNYNFLYR